MIPVLVLPAYSRPDLVERCVAAIDHPVGLLLVIDNSPDGLELAGLAPPDVVERLVIFRPPIQSLGYTGSINFAVGQTPGAGWWAWVSNDVLFGPGDLERIASLMGASPSPRLVTHGFTWGAINAACVRRAGLFDEWSFWPIYFDDTDYLVRCIAAGVEWVVYEGGIVHGADGHAHSLTVKSDPLAAAANARSWRLNRAAYVRKWGGPPGAEKHRTPWGRRLPAWAVRPDPEGRRDRSW